MLKQKFYCQVCEKACKDENGFKLHCRNPGHISKIQIVAQDPDYYINEYSKRFEKAFLEILKYKNRGDFISTNAVYLDYIRDKSNVRLNATRWDTLTKFIFSLKRKGIIDVIDENSDGKFKIKLLGESKETDYEALIKKKKDRIIQDRINEAKEFDAINSNIYLELNEQPNVVDTIKIAEKPDDRYKEEFKHNTHNKESVVNLKEEISLGFLKAKKPKLICDIYDEEECHNQDLGKSIVHSKFQSLLENSKINVDSDYQQTMNTLSKDLIDYKYEVFDLENPWLISNIIVRLKDSKFSEYYNKKFKVTTINKEDNFSAGIQSLDDPHYQLEVDQFYLEPVIPKINSEVKILYGIYAGESANLLTVNTEQGQCELSYNGKRILNVNLKGIAKT